MVVSTVALISCWASAARAEQSPSDIHLEFRDMRPGETRCLDTNVPPGIFRMNGNAVYPPPYVQLGFGFESYVWQIEGMPAHRLCVRVDLWAPVTEELRAVVKTVPYGSGFDHRPGADIIVSGNIVSAYGPSHVALVLWFPLLLIVIGIGLRVSRPRFERGEVLAWRVDGEAGYRDTGREDLELTPLAELSGGRWSLFRPQAILIHEALAGRASTDATWPKVLIQPFPGNEVSVRASVPLFVHRVGDPTARTQEHDAVVPHGSILRAGPLLFAPLTPEQAHSVAHGFLTLDEPGGATVAEERATYAADLRHKPFRALPARLAPLGWAALFLAVLAASAGVALARLSTDAFSVGLLSAMTAAATAAVGLVARRLIVGPKARHTNEPD